MKTNSKHLRHWWGLAIIMFVVSLEAPGVYAQVRNIARGGLATHSSSYMTNVTADKAIDGNTDGTWGGNSLTHTNYDYQAWWQVNVGFTAQINQIKIWNRTDCCPDRLSNYYVLVSDEPFTSADLNTTRSQPGVSSYYFSGAAGSPTTLSVGRTGRYVRVQLVGTNYLTLAEVEIIGGYVGVKNNVALASNRASVSASTTHGGYPAVNAINGDRSGITESGISYWNDNIPNTYNDSLEIAFNGEAEINKINIFSVQDAYTNPVEPDRNMTFTKYGLVDFRVDALVNGVWSTVPNGNITGNNKVWKQITFGAIKATKIRVTVTKAADSWVRIAEVEAILAPQGCQLPGLLQDELLTTIRNNYTGDNGIIYYDNYREEASVRWRKCLQPSFGAWENNGSQNLPVLGAAIGLFREPTLTMTRPSDFSRVGTPRYTKWWNDFLGYQIGALSTTNKSLGHFKGTEIFSSIYDAPVVTAIIAVRYWASLPVNHGKPDASNIDDYARRYLRANWFVYGLSAGAGPLRIMEIPNSEWIYNRYEPRIGGTATGQPKYPGHFIAMAGSRSNADYMTENQRGALLDRAIGHEVNETHVSKYQRVLLDHLTTLWNREWPDSQENLYGLSEADRGAFSNLINNGVISYFNLYDWLHGIKTFRTYSILGWNQGAGKQTRLTVLENNPNGNTPAMYAIKYEQETGTATFLYPWTHHNTAGNCHLAGSSALYSDRVEASQPGVKKKPGCIEEVRPGRSATMPTPQTGKIFHLVLSRDQPAYWETTPQNLYPAPLPYSPWEEIPPGNDDSPPEN